VNGWPLDARSDAPFDGGYLTTWEIEIRAVRYLGCLDYVKRRRLPGHAPFPGRSSLVASPSPLDDLDPLSERERVVLSLVALGLSNKEIADSLHLARGTVKTHVSAILRKLGVRNRTEAALISLGMRQTG